MNQRRKVKKILSQRKLKTHTFNGRKYKIDCDTDIDGWCDQFALNERFIHIHQPLNTQRGLITAIHEALHAENWAANEQTVERVSREIGSFLWRLGFRKIKAGKKMKDQENN